MAKNKFYSNKVAIVSGGGSGIGKAICEYLGKYGSKVIVTDINLDSANKTATTIIQNGGVAEAYEIDVSNSKAVKGLIEGVAEKYGKIDLLFNNAGISLNGEFQDMTLEHWQRIIDVNLWGVVYGCHFVYPLMIKQGYGQIINTASLAGLIPGGLTTSYSASKFGVVGFTLGLRSEASFYGIQVNTLCPGFIKTAIQNTTPIVSEYLNSEKNKKMGSNMKAPTPEKCIKSIMKGVKRNKAIIISPRLHKIFWFLNRLFPTFNIKMFQMVIKRMKKQGF